MKYLKKFGKMLVRALWYTVLVLIAVTLVNIALARHRGQVPQVAGYSIFRIATGSMEPTIPAGTYILTRAVPPDQLRVGDIITYYSRDPVIEGLPNTHRISAICRDRNRERTFVTRGDNNFKDDELPVSEDQIIGRHVVNLERLTAVAGFFMQESVLATMLLLQGISAVLMSLYTKKLRRQQAREKLEAEQALEEKKRALIDAEIRRLQQQGLQDENGKEEGEQP